MTELAGERRPAGRPGTDADHDVAETGGLSLLLEQFEATPSALSYYRSPVDGATLVTEDGSEFVALVAGSDGVVADVVDGAAVDRAALDPVEPTAPRTPPLPGVERRRGD